MKRILILIGSIPGFLLILLTVTANQLTQTSNVEIIDRFLEYSTIIKDMPQIDATLIILITRVSQYSQILLTIGIVWIAVFIYIWIKYKERRLNGKKRK